jgi:hypothetical protein
MKIMNIIWLLMENACTIKPGCVKHIIGGKEVWNCDSNYWWEGYDDFDNDEICSPSDCYDGAIEDCNNGCVNNNGECKEWCESKNDYKNVNGIYVEKGFMYKSRSKLELDIWMGWRLYIH